MTCKEQNSLLVEEEKNVPQVSWKKGGVLKQRTLLRFFIQVKQVSVFLKKTQNMTYFWTFQVNGAHIHLQGLSC